MTFIVFYGVFFLADCSCYAAALRLGWPTPTSWGMKVTPGSGFYMLARLAWPAESACPYGQTDCPGGALCTCGLPKESGAPRREAGDRAGPLVSRQPNDSGGDPK